MKKTEEDPDADRLTNSENKEQSLLNNENDEVMLSRTGKKSLSVIPELKIRRVNNLNNAVLKEEANKAISKSDKKIQILVIFENKERRLALKRAREAFVNWHDSVEGSTVTCVFVVLFMMAAIAYGGCVLEKFSRDLNYREELRKIELEQKRQEINSQHMIPVKEAAQHTCGN